MDQKVVAVVGTARSNGVVSSLCARLLEGAADSGAETELVNLYDYEINHCRGCWSCLEHGTCSRNDDFKRLYDLVWSASVIVLGSPVYIGSVPGIMKTFFDRHVGPAIYNPEDAPDLHRLGGFSKVMRLRSEIKRFGARHENMRGRGFVLVVASTLPFPYTMLTGQTRLALKCLAAFPRRLNGKVLAKLVCTDTLLRFREGKHRSKLNHAYRIGARVASFRPA